MIRRTIRTSTPAAPPSPAAGLAWFTCLRDPMWSRWARDHGKVEKAHAMTCTTCAPLIAAEREIMKLVRAKGLHW